ncbi:hypothetical protein CK623_03360 [Vandammella animalimorsus]|uniref:Uncharacterized protein n=1 Tax=Vandammella animalimorsus TaxID=2029117 RepID=A0A2A2AT62_9BURK|nr:hypothetical protein [Vandammella animalimorsus]PAT40839.1 hypothetical protein CK623_03360 [Vandammella animalimorsus]
MALSAVLWVLLWARWLHGWRSAPLPGWAETALFAAAALTHYHATALAALAPLVLAGLMGLQWPMLQHYRHIAKHDFRAAAQFALQHLQPGDAVYAGFMLNPAGYRYYLQRKADKPARILPLDSAEDAQALCRQAPLPQRFAHLHMAYYPVVAQALQQACGAHFEVLRHERHNVSVGLWRQKP